MYQSNPDRVAAHSYDSAAVGSSDAGVNVGMSNSARGEGTTTSELVATFHRLNCGACLFILAFRAAPIVFRPTRLALLLSSPARLILELIVVSLVLCLLLVEVRVPVLGEKALLLVRRLAVGGRQCLDLDTARGRALSWAIVGVSLGLSNFLAARTGVASGGGVADSVIAPANITNSTNEGGASSDDAAVAASALLIIAQSIPLSPTTLLALLLSGYTSVTIHTFPEYAEAREYSTEEASESTDSQKYSSFAPQSWVSNVGSFGQGRGYQEVHC